MLPQRFLKIVLPRWMVPGTFDMFLLLYQCHCWSRPLHSLSSSSSRFFDPLMWCMESIKNFLSARGLYHYSSSILAGLVYDFLNCIFFKHFRIFLLFLHLCSGNSLARLIYFFFSKMIYFYSAFSYYFCIYVIETH